MLLRFRLIVFFAAILMFANCTAFRTVDFGSVRNVQPGAPLPEGHGVVSGSIRFIANGEPVGYTVLRRPILRLVRREEQLSYDTPATDKQGNFFWSLPYGYYDVRRLLNMFGYTEADQGYMFPQLSFSVAPGSINYLGAIVVDVNVSEKNGWGEVTFQSLNDVRVENQQSRDPNWTKVRYQPNASIQLFQPAIR